MALLILVENSKRILLSNLWFLTFNAGFNTVVLKWHWKAAQIRVFILIFFQGSSFHKTFSCCFVCTFSNGQKLFLHQSLVTEKEGYWNEGNQHCLCCIWLSNMCGRMFRVFWIFVNLCKARTKWNLFSLSQWRHLSSTSNKISISDI